MRPASEVIKLFPEGGDHRRALEALAKIYGTQSTDMLLNYLHALSAQLGVASGVDPEVFARGVWHHWAFVASTFNENAAAEKGRATQ